LKIANVRKMLSALIVTPFVECGFIRVGQKMHWRRVKPDRIQTIEFQSDKYGWDQFLGSKFTFNFEEKYLNPEFPKRGARLGYLLEGHDLLGQIRTINRDIRQNFPEPEVLSAISTLSTGVNQVGIEGENTNLVGEDIWLSYYNENHVLQWGEFFAESLPAIIEIFSDRIESPMQKARNRYNDFTIEIQNLSGGYDRLSRCREIVLKFLSVEKDEKNLAMANESLRSVEKAIKHRRDNDKSL
jgi:hypothetical protein